MNKFYVYSLLLLAVVSKSAYSQLFKDEISSRKISLFQNDTIYNFNVMVGEQRFETELANQYYWFLNDVISNNKGDYTGHLLHGDYIVQLVNNTMIEKGIFEKGIKSGAWKKWYTNGNLKQVEYWESGKKNGKSYYYSVNGRLTKTIDYKSDLIDGYIISYFTNDTVYQEFKKGVFVPGNGRKKQNTSTNVTQNKKPESSFLKKIKLKINERKEKSGGKDIQSSPANKSEEIKKEKIREPKIKKTPVKDLVTP